jgi:radical SAM superfamily enzyme YgiQ (UPF0313 family)
LRRLGFEAERKSLTFSRGLLTVATHTAAEGYDVHYLVMSDVGDRKRLEELLPCADVVAVTAMTPTVAMSADICARAKRANPSVVCVVGGPHIWAAPEPTLERYHSFDYGVLGKGEGVFLLLLKNLDSPDVVPNLVLRDQHGTARLSTATSDPPERCPLPINYGLLSRSMEQYAYNIRTQSGCPFACRFCFESHTYRSGDSNHHEIQSVVAELEQIAHYCPPRTMIHISDPIFNYDSERTSNLCVELARFREQFIFSIDTRVDFVTPEAIKEMSAAGIMYYRLGFENYQDRILSGVRKGITHSTATEAARVIRDIEPRAIVHAYWITGLPGSTREGLAENAWAIRRMIRDQDLLDVVGNKLFVPYPGTPYYESPAELKIELLHTDWSKYDRMSFPVYRLEHLSEYEIYWGFLFTEAVQTQAHIARLGAPPTSPSSSLDYVYSSYVATEVGSD